MITSGYYLSSQISYIYSNGSGRASLDVRLRSNYLDLQYAHFITFGSFYYSPCIIVYHIISWYLVVDPKVDSWNLYNNNFLCF